MTKKKWWKEHSSKDIEKLLKGIPKFQRKLSSKTSNVLHILPKISRLKNDQSSTNIPKPRLPLCRGRRVTGKEYYTSTTLFFSLSQYESISSTLFLSILSLPLYSLQGGSPSLQGFSPLWPPLPGKAIKTSLYYFTQNSVCHQWTEVEFLQQYHKSLLWTTICQ